MLTHAVVDFDALGLVRHALDSQDRRICGWQQEETSGQYIQAGCMISS